MAHRLAVLLLLLIALTSSAASQATPSAVRVGVSVMADHLIKKVAPIYPPLAKQAHVQGAVLLRVRISKSGDVLTTQLISGHPLLAPAAIEAVKQWKYTPYLLNGEPVEVETDATVNFTLSDNPAEGGVAGDTPNGPPCSQVPDVGGVTVPTPADSTHPSIPRRVRLSSNSSLGLMCSKVSPIYPQGAKTAHIQGTVVLKATIDKQGNVSNLELVSGHPMLVPAAIEAVKQWRYKPYLLDGARVEVETTVQVNFSLAN